MAALYERGIAAARTAGRHTGEASGPRPTAQASPSPTQTTVQVALKLAQVLTPVVVEAPREHGRAGGDAATTTEPQCLLQIAGEVAQIIDRIPGLGVS